MFRQLPQDFQAADLRQHLAAWCGRDPTTITPGAMTYQLRRLRLKGLIAPPNNFRYCVTDLGCCVALFFTRTSTAFCDLASPPHCQRCEPLLAP